MTTQFNNILRKRISRLIQSISKRMLLCLIVCTSLEARAQEYILPFFKYDGKIENSVINYIRDPKQSDNVRDTASNYYSVIHVATTDIKKITCRYHSPTSGYKYYICKGNQKASYPDEESIGMISMDMHMKDGTIESHTISPFTPVYRNCWKDPDEAPNAYVYQYRAHGLLGGYLFNRRISPKIEYFDFDFKGNFWDCRILHAERLVIDSVSTRVPTAIERNYSKYTTYDYYETHRVYDSHLYFYISRDSLFHDIFIYAHIPLCTKYNMDQQRISDTSLTSTWQLNRKEFDDYYICVDYVYRRADSPDTIRCVRRNVEKRTWVMDSKWGFNMQSVMLPYSPPIYRPNERNYYGFPEECLKNAYGYDLKHTERYDKYNFGLAN